jgi:hypothetical protein
LYDNRGACTVAVIVVELRLLVDSLCRDLASAPSWILTCCYPAMAADIFADYIAVVVAVAVDIGIAVAGRSKVVVVAVVVVAAVT